MKPLDYSKPMTIAQRQHLGMFIDKILSLTDGQSVLIDCKSRKYFHTWRNRFYDWCHDNNLKQCYTVKYIHPYQAQVIYRQPIQAEFVKRQSITKSRAEQLFEKHLLMITNEDSVRETLMPLLDSNQITDQEFLDTFDLWRRVNDPNLKRGNPSDEECFLDESVASQPFKKEDQP